jgi:ribose transport system ATP-binding protein
MVVQETGTIPGISVAENLFLGEMDAFQNKLGFIDRIALHKQAAEALAIVGDARITPEMPTAALSLQERKLLEIVRIWAKRPEVLIVDESTTALSQSGREALYHLMNQMKQDDRAVVFISHDLDEIMRVCDRLTVLRDGEIITHFDKQDFNEEAIKLSMIGRALKGDYYRADGDATPPGEAVLTAEGISHGTALHDVSLTLHRGEILGIGGLSHAGMHELGKALYGALLLDAGTVIAGDRPIHSVQDAIRCRMGYVAKDRDVESLSLNANIRDNIAIAGLAKFAQRGLLFPWRERRYVQRQVDALSIKCSGMGQAVATLSGGNKQKVVFGKWIGADADIFILDCPTRGVDIGVKQAMYQLIATMQKAGKSFILISEEMTELIGMADRILIMKEGRVAQEFMRSPSLTEADMIRYMI